MDRVTPPNYRVPSTPQPTDDRHTETEEGGRRGCPLATLSRVGVCALSLQARLHHPPCTSGARDQSHHFPTRPQPTTPDISCIALASQSQRPGPAECRETTSALMSSHTKMKSVGHRNGVDPSLVCYHPSVRQLPKTEWGRHPRVNKGLARTTTRVVVMCVYTSHRASLLCPLSSTIYGGLTLRQPLSRTFRVLS